jgi:hypothetical protein
MLLWAVERLQITLKTPFYFFQLCVAHSTDPFSDYMRLAKQLKRKRMAKIFPLEERTREFFTENLLIS